MRKLMPTFEENAEELVNHINLLSQRLMVIQFELDKDDVEVNKQEVRVISYVGTHGPVIMRDIADHLQLVSSAVTAIVNKLVDKKLVRRFRDKSDRRFVKVDLTPTGREIYQLEMANHTNLSKTVLAVLTPEEQDILLMLFRKISKHIQAI